MGVEPDLKSAKVDKRSASGLTVEISKVIKIPGSLKMNPEVVINLVLYGLDQAGAMDLKRIT